LRPWRLAISANSCEGIASERLDFSGRQLPPLPRQKIAKRKPADRDPFELMHLVAEFGQHAPDLTVLAFVENHLEDRALLVLAAEAYPFGVDFAFGQANALPEPIEQLETRHPCDLHEVFFLDAVAGMGQKVCQVTVVRQENQSFARAIEPPHGEETTVTRDEIDHTGASGRVVVRRHHTDGLVEEVDDAPRIRKPLTIDTNFLGARIDLRAKRGDHHAVDLDAA
jgi:hypothetical protein